MNYGTLHTQTLHADDVVDKSSEKACDLLSLSQSSAAAPEQLSGNDATGRDSTHNGISSHETGQEANQQPAEQLVGNKWQIEDMRKEGIYSHCHIQANEDADLTQVDQSARRRLIAASIICLIFMICEIVGGVWSNSLAIATDAAHLLTDFASFMISLFAIWLGSRPATRNMSFGWYRAEVIGALLSVLMIWLVTGLLVYMAIERISTQTFEINSLVMVVTATLGLLINMIMAVALHAGGEHTHGHFHTHAGHSHHSHLHDDDDEDDSETDETNRHEIIAQSPNEQCSDVNVLIHRSGLAGQQHSQASLTKCSSAKKEARGRGKSNINVRAAFIHVVGDFLQSLGVLIAALVIHFEPAYTIVDPICTFLFSAIVLVTTLGIIRDAINVLMEGIPNGVNFVEVREKLQSIDGVIKVHNLRIWSLSMDKIAMSTHLVKDFSRTQSQILKEAIDMLRNSFNFLEITIQIEEFKDDMKDCQHCQSEDVVIDIGSNRATS